MARMNAAKALIDSVLLQGVDTVFGLPGGQIYDLYDALHSAGDRVRVVTSRHEQGAAYMAYGYARSTGKVGVFVVVPGPGLLNTTAALCTAYGASTPVLAIAGQIPSEGIGRGIGYLHELPDQLGMIRGVTKWAQRIERPEDAPALVREAFRQLLSGRPRPVELEMAMDVTGIEADVALDRGPVAVAPPEPDPDALAAAAKLLGRARQPLIYVGSGASDAAPEVLAIAEALQAPVVAFRQGRGVVSDEHYLSQCFPAGHRLWADADAVLAVGTRFKYPLLHWGAGGIDVVRIDIDETEVARVREPAVGIVADAAQALAQLIPLVEKHNRARRSRERELEELKAGFDREFRRKLAPQMGYLSAIRRALPRDGLFVDEVTQTGFVSWYGFPVYAPRQFISSGYQGTLGFGYATALGVKVGNPDRKVVQISGDGGIMYNLAELATAVQHRLQVVTVVFRDDRFGNVYRAQRERPGEHVIATALHNPDFVAVAEGFGAAGERVTGADELERAIERGFERDGPTLIEVPVGELPSPWEYVLLPRVRGD